MQVLSKWHLMCSVHQIETLFHVEKYIIYNCLVNFNELSARRFFLFISQKDTQISIKARYSKNYELFLLRYCPVFTLNLILKFHVNRSTDFKNKIAIKDFNSTFHFTQTSAINCESVICKNHVELFYKKVFKFTEASKRNFDY